MLKKLKSIFRERSSKIRRDVKLKRPAYADRHEGENFLILASGPSLKEYQGRIRAFINKIRPVVMAGNFIDNMFIPDYHAFVNRKRFCNYAGSINPASKVLLSPYFSIKIIKRYFSESYELIAFENHYPSQEGSISISDGIVYVKGGTIATILMGIAVVMGAKDIYVAGLDGYSKSTPTHYYLEHDNKATDDLIIVERSTKAQLACLREHLRAKKPGNGDLYIITPTVYESFYEPIESFLV